MRSIVQAIAPLEIHTAVKAVWAGKYRKFSDIAWKPSGKQRRTGKYRLRAEKILHSMPYLDSRVGFLILSKQPRNS